MACVVNIKELMATKVILPQLVDILKSTLNREKLNADTLKYFQTNLELWESFTFPQISKNIDVSKTAKYLHTLKKTLKNNNQSLQTSIKNSYQDSQTHNAMLKVCNQIECKLLNIIDMLITEFECIASKP